ncbi:(2Fe-2S)-binding protein [Azospirillum melinis]|uniref:Bacterioferritin-associated ferredoxin n=1 Tax=Azospirillum melinis TaxID=328839 RepID=A0ABX2KK61_9PROT|nr:(2Fe-2S)-binding protein [Azospirillum melinis]MBP2303897.1 bacterioferritin-associated ferredoxin [Azospirillum melinis]NUB03073.1 (2Fe-2S)-binding protein [Azospirillum melinis]
MYVCICHALNDKKVKAALDQGATTPASVFRHHNCQVQCGKCVPTMRSMASEHRATVAQQTAAAAAVAATPVAAPCCGSALPEPANAEAVPAYAIAAE